MKDRTGPRRDSCWEASSPARTGPLLQTEYMGEATSQTTPGVRAPPPPMSACDYSQTTSAGRPGAARATPVGPPAAAAHACPRHHAWERTAEAPGACPAPACPATETSRNGAGHSLVPTARPAPGGLQEAARCRPQSDSGIGGWFSALMWQCSREALLCSVSVFTNKPKVAGVSIVSL